MPTYFAEEEIAEFKSYLELNIEFYWVVEMNKVVVACGGVNTEKVPYTHSISWDIVHPDYHKQGIGTLLLKERIDFIDKQNSKAKIVVRTSQLTDGYYSKFGFETTKIVPDFWSEGYDLYEMCLNLSQTNG